MTVTSLSPAVRPAVPMASVQGALALDLHPDHRPPDGPAATAPGCQVATVDPRTHHRLQEWSRRYTQVACDVVAGLRPAAQLVRWSSPSVQGDLVRRAHLVARAGQHRPGGRSGAPVRPRVVSVRACFLTPDTAEVAVRVAHGPRHRAVAARFEVHAGHWICVALDFS